MYGVSDFLLCLKIKWRSKEDRICLKKAIFGRFKYLTNFRFETTFFAEGYQE